MKKYFSKICLLLIVLINIVLTSGCPKITGTADNQQNGAKKEIFNVPDELISYNEIINKYNVTIGVDISEKDAEELFTVVKIYKETNGLDDEKINLNKLTLKRLDEKTIRVDSLIYWENVTAAAGYYLWFTKIGPGKWQLDSVSRWIS
jgi:hypothetical protein